MKLSDLIEVLTEVLLEDGDMEVYFGDMEPCGNIEVVPADDEGNFRGVPFVHIGDW